MRILLLTTRFSTKTSSPWLTNELAETLKSLGHDVTVLCLDWASVNERGLFNVNGIPMFNYPAISLRFVPDPLGKVIKWFCSSIFAYRYFVRCIEGRADFDALVSFSPCAAAWFCIIGFNKRVAKRMVVYWDFFPIHNYQIGKIRNKFLLRPAFLFEKYLLSKFDSAGCMSEMNVAFFRNYFSLGAKVKVFELPVWGRRSLDNAERGAALFDRSQFGYAKLAVFGGQLEYGRGVDKLLQLAKELRSRNEDVALVIAGDGPLKSSVIEASQDGKHNLFYLGQLSRGAYLNFIRTCDIGIISTQTNVSVPTYPSKCIDYLLAPLPMVAIVEKSTDFGTLIQESGCGLVCASDSINELVNKVVNLAGNDLQREKMRSACSIFFEQRHDVVNVAKKLVNELAENGAEGLYV